MKEENKSNPELNKFPSIYWEKFFLKFPEIETLPVKDWKTVHLLSYFSSLYQNHYKVSYSFRFNSPSPSKSYEVFQLRKLGQIISTDPQILKDYFDWFFEHQIILKKKRITSLALLVDTNICNQYKIKVLALDYSKSIERTTLLPSHILEIAKTSNIDCKTYGDLSFLFKSISSKEEQGFIDSLKTSGFDFVILGNVR